MTNIKEIFAFAPPLPPSGVNGAVKLSKSSPSSLPLNGAKHGLQSGKCEQTLKMVRSATVYKQFNSCC